MNLKSATVISHFSHLRRHISTIRRLNQLFQFVRRPSQIYAMGVKNICDGRRTIKNSVNERRYSSIRMTIGKLVSSFQVSIAPSNKCHAKRTIVQVLRRDSDTCFYTKSSINTRLHWQRKDEAGTRTGIGLVEIDK